MLPIAVAACGDVWPKTHSKIAIKNGCLDARVGGIWQISRRFVRGRSSSLTAGQPRLEPTLASVHMKGAEPSSKASMASAPPCFGTSPGSTVAAGSTRTAPPGSGCAGMVKRSRFQSQLGWYVSISRAMSCLSDAFDCGTVSKSKEKVAWARGSSEGSWREAK
eukprot:scaffold57950_cov30-Tisochrysis_lutea.AAC.9